MGISHAEPAAQPVKEHRSEIVLALGAVAKLAVAGTVILLLAIIITIAAPLISPYGPNEVPDHAERLMPPLSPGFILGTDGQGRDILSRIIWGGRVSIPIAMAPIAVSSVAGLILGLIAGFAGGLLGGFIMRGLDIVFAFPGVLLSVAVAAIFGSGMMNVMFAMSIVLVPWVARIVYVETVSTLQMESIEAAKACNAGTMRILFREVLPNAISPVIVFGTTSLGAMIVFRRGFELPRRRCPAADGRLGDHGLRRPQRRRLGALDLDRPRRRDRDRSRGLQFCRRWPARRARPTPKDAPLKRRPDHPVAAWRAGPSGRPSSQSMTASAVLTSQ